MARFSEEERKTIWDMREAGVPVTRIAMHLDRQNSSLRMFIADHGGTRPTARERSEPRLSLAEREEISRGLAAGLSIRAIAAGLERSPSTVCREVNANGGRRRYRALVADKGAMRRACVPSGPRSPSADDCARPWNGSSKLCGLPNISPRGWLRPTPTTRRCRCPTRPSISPSSFRDVVRCEKSCIRASERAEPCGGPRPSRRAGSARARSATW
jgi:hypothetical protein